jgi:hypothetical protein
MPVTADILRAFSDELCKLAGMPALGIAGMKSSRSLGKTLGTIAAKPQYSSGPNLAASMKSLPTPTTGKPGNSAVQGGSFFATGRTGTLKAPSPNLVR